MAQQIVNPYSVRDAVAANIADALPDPLSGFTVSARQDGETAGNTIRVRTTRLALFSAEDPKSGKTLNVANVYLWFGLVTYSDSAEEIEDQVVALMKAVSAASMSIFQSEMLLTDIPLGLYPRRGEKKSSSESEMYDYSAFNMEAVCQIVL